MRHVSACETVSGDKLAGDATGSGSRGGPGGCAAAARRATMHSSRMHEPQRALRTCDLLAERRDVMGVHQLIECR